MLKLKKLLFLLCVFGFVALPLNAQQNDDKNQRNIDKSQAAARAKQQVNGRVLRVDQNKNKYRVKVLQKSGRVVSVDVDKKSGKVRQQKKKEYKQR